MLEVALLALAVLVVALSIGVPLPMCFGAGLMVMSLLGGVTMKGTMLWGFGQLGNPVLLAIPLFILAGTLMSVSGIAASLLKLVDVFIGHVRGGLGVVATLSCAVIGAISGSGLTGVAAIGPLLIPEMTKQGYPRGYATALVACSSVLGLLIPPSVTMIVYGWVTDTSILASFLATLGPGLMITASLIVVNLVTARRFDLQLQARPDLATMLAQARRRSAALDPDPVELRRRAHGALRELIARIAERQSTAEGQSTDGRWKEFRAAVEKAGGSVVATEPRGDAKADTKGKKE